MTRFLTLDDVIAIAVQQFGSPPPIRDVGLLDSAVARPASTVMGDDAYPDLWTKAAALLQSLVGNLALIDGNERLGWTASVVFGALNSDVDVASVDLNGAYDLVIDVASDSSLTVDSIADRLLVLLGR
ncbi:MAG: Fic family protein [Ilumatobacter sp.]|uniref:type II toxin-antitoxin system death-on-curing family toxin n=1 Tax=Ilumatobacter sp. TaxID=1967498 RepID=UPI003298D8DD